MGEAKREARNVLATMSFYQSHQKGTKEANRDVVFLAAVPFSRKNNPISVPTCNRFLPSGFPGKRSDVTMK